jgi:hypothetical protein
MPTLHLPFMIGDPLLFDYNLNGRVLERVKDVKD